MGRANSPPPVWGGTVYNKLAVRNTPASLAGWGDICPSVVRRAHASRHQGTKRPIGVCAGEQAPVVQAILWLWRAMPDIDFGRIEIDALQRLGKRHGLSGGIALGQLGHALKEIRP